MQCQSCVAEIQLQQNSLLTSSSYTCCIWADLRNGPHEPTTIPQQLIVLVQILVHKHTTKKQPFYKSYCTGQPVIAGTPVKNWRNLLQHSFATCMFLQMTTSAYVQQYVNIQTSLCCSTNTEREHLEITGTGFLKVGCHSSTRVGWLEFNVPFQHKYGYIRDEIHPPNSIKAPTGTTKPNQENHPLALITNFWRKERSASHSRKQK